MNAELIAVGTEILLGDILNTHAKFLSNELAELGINLLYHTTVGDNKQRLQGIVAQALQRSDLIVVTGGLGPTKDDLTKETVCEQMGVPLVRDEQTVHRIKDYFQRLGKEMPENNLKQALLPEGGTVFQNQHGTAPGMAVQKNGKTAILLPGPPHELVPMFQEQVRPYLMQFTDSVILSHSLRIFGLGESRVDELLDELLDNQNPTVALYAKRGEVLARITAKAETKEKCEEMVSHMVEQVKQRVGEYVYGMDVSSLEEVLVKQLIQHNKSIALAESCTGGMVAEKITSIPGSSQCFSYGIVSYANRVKAEELGVDPTTLKTYGAVSHQVAEQMASCAKQRGQADIGIGITGIAGPDGGTPEKPVGLVYVGVAFHNQVRSIELHLSRGLPDERQDIRQRTAMHALSLALNVLNQELI